MKRNDLVEDTATRRWLGTSLLIALAAAGCNESSKTAPSGSPASSAAAAKSSGSAAPAGGDATMGGELDVKLDEKYAVKLKVGAAFVDLFPRELDEDGKPGAYKFFIRAFNEGVKGATCDTEPSGDKPIGGNDWALTFDTINMDSWTVGSKDPLPLSPAFFYKGDLGPRSEAPWATMSKNEVFIESFSEKAVTFRFDMEHSSRIGGEGAIKGKLTAKVCKIEK